MTRPHNLPMASGLVAVGVGGAHGFSGLLESPGTCAQLALVTVLVLLTTATSMMVNDYWDHALNVDSDDTHADRPLVSQTLQPPTVKAALKCMYAGHLALILLVSTPSLRLCIYFNTLATFLYSRVFKPLPGVKNLVCAAVIAMSVGTGAAVVSGGSVLAGIAAVWPLMLVVFAGTLHREVLMDVLDADGDAAAGIRTVPVLLGRRRALLAAAAPLLVAAAVLTLANPQRWAAVAPLGIMASAAAAAAAATDPLEGRGKLKHVSMLVELAPLGMLMSVLLAMGIGT